MKKCSICHVAFILLVSISYAFAQDGNIAYWKPKIIDFTTGTPLETANISINKKVDYPIGNNGLANIPLNKINEGDSIFVSCMGYQTSSFYVQNKKNLRNTIELTPVSYGLKEVEISKSKNKFKEITVGTQAFTITSVGVYYNSSFGLYINNKDKKNGLHQSG
ncbi:hypothetical protein [Pedobacter sp. UBA4863]|uniref:hypothetical protein n=1 Tax=Pedobacter sp. UBA4863 TaxID=1947060 RepID=UPI0025F58448|nr:hypothetical protein [Pedobacter sp. UBA4863]